MPKRTLADRIKEAAEKRGVTTNAAFARLMKWNPQTTHNYWKGITTQPPGSELFALSEKLKVNPKWLLLEEGPMEIATPELPKDQAELLSLYRRAERDEKELILKMAKKVSSNKDDSESGTI